MNFITFLYPYCAKKERLVKWNKRCFQRNQINIGQSCTVFTLYRTYRRPKGCFLLDGRGSAYKKSVYVHVYALFYMLLDAMMFRTEQTVIECILYHFGFATEAEFAEDTCLVGVNCLEAEAELFACFG